MMLGHVSTPGGGDVRLLARVIGVLDLQPRLVATGGVAGVQAFCDNTFEIFEWIPEFAYFNFAPTRP